MCTLTAGGLISSIFGKEVKMNVPQPEPTQTTSGDPGVAFSNKLLWVIVGTLIGMLTMALTAGIWIGSRSSDIDIIEKKVEQLESIKASASITDAISEKLVRMETMMGSNELRIRTMERSETGTDRRLTSIEDKLTSIEEKLDRINN
jgi:hypothetical protein